MKSPKEQALKYGAAMVLLIVGLSVTVLAFRFAYFSIKNNEEKNAQIQASRLNDHFVLNLTNQLFRLKHMEQVFTVRFRNMRLPTLALDEKFWSESLFERVDLISEHKGTIKIWSTQGREASGVNKAAAKLSHHEVWRGFNDAFSKLRESEHELLLIPPAQGDGQDLGQWRLCLLYRLSGWSSAYIAGWIPLAQLVPSPDPTQTGELVLRNADYPDMPAVSVNFVDEKLRFETFQKITGDTLWPVNKTSSITLLGENLRLRYFTSPTNATQLAWLVLASGLLITFLLTAWMQSLINRNVEVRQIVATRTSDLALAVEQAQAANNAKSRFLANMSHEVRTPLNIILGMADLLGLTQLNTDQSKYVETFRRSGKHLLGLIEDIMDNVRLEGGELSLEKSDVNLSDLLHEVAAFSVVPARQKKLDFSLFVDPGLPLTVTTDGKRLRQALLNLINNAIKFTDTGSVNLRAQLLSSDGRSAQISFAVIDTGIGMDEPSQGKIFGEFVQLDPSSTRNRGGMGLGLAIVQTIANRLNGFVQVTSGLGKGSQFTLTLPFEVTDSRAWVDALWTTRNSMLAKTIFLMMNDNDSRESLRQGLTGLGFQVTLSHSGAETLQNFRDIEATHDLLILDSVMPDTGAISILQKVELTQATKDKTCVMLQPLHRKNDMATLATLGFGRIVFRPASVKTLLQAWEIKPAAVRSEDSSADFALNFDMRQKILIVEDDEDNRNLIRAYLKPFSNLQCGYACDGVEALEAFHAFLPDIVLTDIQMPNMDGFELSRRLRALEGERHLKPATILALTADALPEQMIQAKNAGIDHYLTKPISRARLLSSLVLHSPSRPSSAAASRRSA